MPRQSLSHQIGAFELAQGVFGSGHIAAQGIGPDEMGYGGAGGIPQRIQRQVAGTLADGDAVYQGSGEFVGRALASTSGQMPAVGVADGAISNSGEMATIIIAGPKSSANYNFSGYVGHEAYVSPDSSGIVETRDLTVSGEIVQVIGHMYNVSTLIVAVGPMMQRGGGQF